MKNEEYREAKRHTRFGKLVSGTSYEDYAINNKQLNDDVRFLEKKQGTAKFYFSFIYNNDTFGVWFDYTLGKIYVSNDFIKNSPFTFACTLKDHSTNTLLLSSVKKYNCWKVFIEQFRQGNVRFENSKIKFVVQDLIKVILTK